MLKKAIHIVLILVLIGCSSTKTAMTDTEAAQALDQLIESGSFKIRSTWAQPQVTMAVAQLSGTGLIAPGSTVGNIDITGNVNYLEFNEGKVKAFLPFYGERQMGGAYNTNNLGIEFEGEPEAYKTNKGKKNSHEFRFTISDKNNPAENYMVYVQVFPNMTSSININSSHRTNIRYRGKANSIVINEN